MFNWRVASPNTLKAYHTAGKDFETVTSIRVDRADLVSIESWKASMEARGLSVNTIRSRLSAVSILSGVKVQLPKKQKAECPIMSDDQVQAFFRQIHKEEDRELLVRLILTGHLRQLRAHWLSPTLTTQEITRKIKRYARLAGLDETQVNLRTLVRTGQELTSRYDAAYLLEHILPRPIKHAVEWKPLHGIGRRSNRLARV